MLIDLGRIKNRSSLETHRMQLHIEMLIKLNNPFIHKKKKKEERK